MTKPELYVLSACLHDAVNNAMIDATVTLHSSIQGTFLVVKDPHGHPIAVATALQPQERPFVQESRDKVRSAASRIGAQLVILCTFRTIVAYSSKRDSEAGTQFTMHGIWEGAMVADTDQMMAPGNKQAVTDALQRALALSATLRLSWTEHTLAELARCCHNPRIEDFPNLLMLADLPMNLPEPGCSVGLMLDVVQAYVHDAYNRGASELQKLPTFEVRAEFQQLFSELVREIVFAGQWELYKAPDRQKARIWAAAYRGIPVPTFDAIDFAVIASDIHAGSKPPVIIESGSSMGRIEQRVQLLVPGATVRIESALAGTPEEIMDALHQISGVPHATLLWFTPMQTLRSRLYAHVRTTLLDNFRVRWILFADAESFTTPDAGVCCVIAETGTTSKPDMVSFACLRMPRSTVIEPTEPEAFGQKRIESIQQYIRYLHNNGRNRTNAEVSVRHVRQHTLLRRSKGANSSWDDLIIPPDDISAIINKISNRLIPLTSLADVHNGIRTGANEILLPAIDEIVRKDLESRFWQRCNDHGNLIDNTVITSDSEIESIYGIPPAYRRLLVLGTERDTFSGSNVGKHITEAEEAGIHLRPSLQQRTPWWHLGELIQPDLIIPKTQSKRWIVALNPAHAFVTDAAIGITVHHAPYSGPIALWLNSTVGLFYHLLLRNDAVHTDVTVRDARELLIPDRAILDQIDVQRHRELLFRPIRTLADEYGTDNPDAVRLDGIRRDRRRIDRWLMEHIFKLTPQEQLWLYRLTLAWFTEQTNVAHIATALASRLAGTYKLAAMSEWYDTRINQLPKNTTRTMVIEAETTHATNNTGMFGTHVTLWKGAKAGGVIDCSSDAEAELVALLINLGRTEITIPSDEPLVQEVLPLVQTFSNTLDTALQELRTAVPADLFPAIAAIIQHDLVQM